MTNQEKKAQLNKYREAEAEAVRLEGEISRWRSRAEKVTTAVKMIPGGPGSGNRVEEAVMEIDELTEQLVERRLETVRLRRELEDAIAAVEDWKLRQLLRYRYVDGMKWERISEVMGYERRHVTRLHGDALTVVMFSEKSCP